MAQKIDITFVIDTTQRTALYIHSIKEFVKNAGYMLNETIKGMGYSVEQLRTRLVSFTDYAVDGKNAITQTDFFTLPQDRQAFESAVDNIECSKHITTERVSNSLEALYAAINSGWTIFGSGGFGRHIVFLISYNYPLHLMERKGCDGYPYDEMPPDISDFENVWNADEQDSTLSRRNKRLILYVPEGDDGAGHSWDDVMSWEYTWCRDIYNVEPEECLLELIREMFMS